MCLTDSCCLQKINVLHITQLVEVKSAERKLYFSLTHHYEKSPTVFFVNKIQRHVSITSIYFCNKY
jgi:hypothetical protein